MVYVLVAFVALVLIQSVLTALHRKTLSYSQFKSLRWSGRITEAIVGPGTVSGTFTPTELEGNLPAVRITALKRVATSAHPFVTARVEDPALVGELEAAKVRSAGRAGGRAGKGTVEMADFEEAIERIVARPGRKSRIMTLKEKAIVAHHEAGYALVQRRGCH